MSKKHCTSCSSNQLATISSYKRKWQLCKSCGSSFPEEKALYPLAFLPRTYLKKQNISDPASIYDYFASEAHEKISQQDYQSFSKRYESELDFGKGDKNILDISGGSGHFLKQFKNNAKELVMTEINAKAISNANENLDIKAIQFDFNKDDLHAAVVKNGIDFKFDIVLMRACSMFCLDFLKFIESLKKCLNPGAKIFITRNVVPTVGVLMRTQFDDFSYLILRQPQMMQQTFNSSEFSILDQEWEREDFPFYVWDHDLDPITLGISTFYSTLAVLKLRKIAQTEQEKFPFRARDRKIFSMIVKYAG